MSLQLQPLQRYYSENSGCPVSACVIRPHYSVTFTQSIHAINGFIVVGRVGNLLSGISSYDFMRVCVRARACVCVCVCGRACACACVCVCRLMDTE